MGGSKKTTTNSTQNASTQTTLPAWMTQAGQGLYGDAKAAADKSQLGTQYGGEMTAGSTANQTQAANTAAATQGAWQPTLAGATALTGQAATAGPASVGAAMWSPEAAGYYMNPFLKNVQSDTLAQMRTQGDMDHQAVNDSAQAAKAYGGSRHAILEGQLMKDQANARTNYVDSSNAAAYDNAEGQFNSDANRGLTADTTNAGLYEQMLSRMMGGGAQLGQLAATGSGLNTQDISNLAATGGTQHDINQAADSARYAEWQRSQAAPMDQYAQLMAILNGTPRDVKTSGTTTMNGTQTESGGGLMNTLMGLGQLGLSAYKTFSDPRLKKHVSLIERLANGLGVYRFRYLWERSSSPENIGVMADEVARIAPEALGPVVSGFLTVNYPKLAEMLA